jgi:uncharacterized protein YecE (DUF72 family)
MLRDWARKIERWGERLKEVMVYFDNDQAGYAAQNALELKRMMAGRSFAAGTQRRGQSVSRSLGR